LLENAGVMIDGIVSDAGTSNRKLWKEFGINGTKDNLKNSILHPMNRKRRIYFFSDAPHILLKTVRNRLYNKKTLRVSL